MNKLLAASIASAFAFACAACRAPPPPPPPIPPSQATIPAPGDYKVTGLKAPLAGLGAPAESGEGRVLSFSGSNGSWRCEHVRWDDQGRATDILVIVGRVAGAQSTLDWSLVTTSDGKPHERFTGKLLLRAVDGRRVDGLLTFDEIPNRQDRIALERLEDPLSGN